MKENKRPISLPILPAEEACCHPAQAPTRSAALAVVRLMSAMGDPTRLGIIEMLAGLDEPLCVCDITAQFSLGQPTISHHLKVLRDVGLVRWEKQGLWVYYSLDRGRVEEAMSYLRGLLDISAARVRMGS